VSYGTVDKGLLTSSLLDQGPLAVAVMFLIIAEKDKFGVTTLNPRAVAKLLRIPVSEAQKAFDVLTSPDPESSNKEHEGRRLIPYGDSGKWLVVSHDKYQHEHSLARKRERDAEAQRRHREREKLATAPVEACSVCGGEATGALKGVLYCDAHMPEEAPF
jgi:hypothetical protein